MRRERAGGGGPIGRRRWLGVALGVLFFLPAFSDSAQAATFTPCSGASGFVCATVTVPLDYSGATPGTIPLYVMRKPAVASSSPGALFALAGGPGQAASPVATAFADGLASTLATRDLIVFDQRGTGNSAFLACPQAEQARTTQEFVQQCASEIGAQRDFYTTLDSARDIESVRQELGVDKIAIYGVSYGTYVAQMYAALYPEHVEMLALDSVVPPNGLDIFQRTNFEAIPLVLRSNCAGGLCRGITADPFADLSKIVTRAGSKGIPVRYVSLKGAPAKQVRLDQAFLFEFFLQGGWPFDAVARARMPAALRSSLAGDPFPLGRLLAPLFLSGGAPAPGDTSFSDAVNVATLCTDVPEPWALSDPVEVRAAKRDGVLAQIPASAFAPFTAATAVTTSVSDFCVWWPPTSIVPTTPAAAASNGFPNVPVLVLDGEEDSLTPLADARTAAANFPLSSVVPVPFTGHSDLTDVWPNADTCVANSISSFFAGGAASACSGVNPYFTPVFRNPTALGQLRPVGVKGKRGRTIAATLDTLQDMTDTIMSQMEPLVGLRRGYIDGTLRAAKMHSMVYVPGVTVSGTVDLVSGIAKVTISGTSASHGSLTIHAGGGAITGKLGGKPVNVKHYSLVTVRAAVALSPSLRSLPLVGVPRRPLPELDALLGSLRFRPSELPLLSLS
jgi:pimeloyl-ACP methyl ester carboxylesterase